MPAIQYSLVLADYFFCSLLFSLAAFRYKHTHANSKLIRSSWHAHNTIIKQINGIEYAPMEFVNI